MMGGGMQNRGGQMGMGVTPASLHPPFSSLLPPPSSLLPLPSSLLPPFNDANE